MGDWFDHMVNYYHQDDWCQCPGCGFLPIRSEVTCPEDQTGEDRLCDQCRSALQEKGHYKAYVDLIIAHRGVLVKEVLDWPPVTCYTGGSDDVI